MHFPIFSKICQYYCNVFAYPVILNKFLIIAYVNGFIFLFFICLFFIFVMRLTSNSTINIFNISFVSFFLIFLK